MIDFFFFGAVVVSDAVDEYQSNDWVNYCARWLPLVDRVNNTKKTQIQFINVNTAVRYNLHPNSGVIKIYVQIIGLFTCTAANDESLQPGRLALEWERDRKKRETKKQL